MTTQPEPMLWLDDHRGIYIPRDFANSFADRDKTVEGVDPEAWSILEAGPDHDFYWDTWDEVMNDATVDIDGAKYSVYQDGPCWLIPEGMVYSDETEFFVWPEPETPTTDVDDDAIPF